MIRRSTNELSIKPKMSAKARILWSIAALTALVGALVGTHWLGVQQGHADFESDKTKIAQLRVSLNQANDQLRQAEDDLIVAERQRQIQDEAYNQLSQAYANSEDKNQVLGSTLDFYRSIISPEDGQSGPAIQALEHRLSEDEFQFDVTLVQAIKHKVQIRGQLTVELYAGEELLGQWPRSAARSVNYQYFTKLSGAIALRSGAFDESTLSARVVLDLSDGDSIERSFSLSTAQSLISISAY